MSAEWNKVTALWLDQRPNLRSSQKSKVYVCRFDPRSQSPSGHKVLALLDNWIFRQNVVKLLLLQLLSKARSNRLPATPYDIISPQPHLWPTSDIMAIPGSKNQFYDSQVQQYNIKQQRCLCATSKYPLMPGVVSVLEKMCMSANRHKPMWARHASCELQIWPS